MTVIISNESSDSDRIEEALKLAWQYGQNDGAHHLQWVVDQMVRALTGNGYEDWVAEYEGEPDDENNYYSWDTGTPA